MSKEHHTESSHSHDQKRKELDRKMREYEHDTPIGNPWHQSNPVRIGMAVVAIVAIVSLTLLFMSGIIKW